MANTDPAFMEQARQSLDKLIARYLRYPEVVLIDLGLDPEQAPGEEQKIVLRVHIKSSSAIERLQLPSEIDGIPVRVILADYRLQ